MPTFRQIEKKIDSEMRKVGKQLEKLLYARIKWLVDNIHFVTIQQIQMGMGTWLYEGPNVPCNKLWMGEAGCTLEVQRIVDLALDGEFASAKKPTKREIKYVNELEDIMSYLTFRDNPYVYPKDFDFTKG